MKSLVLFVSLLAALAASGQSFLLPVVKNGQWQLVDTNGVLVRETPYSYIHTYDMAGFTYFSIGGLYGLLNDKGQEVAPGIYSDVQQIGNGKYELKHDAGWIYFDPLNVSSQLAADTLESYEVLNDSWALTGKKDNIFLLNQLSRKTWNATDSSTRIEQLHDHIVLEYNDSLRYLLDGNGNVVFSGWFRHTEQNGAYSFYKGDDHYLFDAFGKWSVPGMTKVAFNSEGVVIQTKTGAALYSYGRNVIVSGDYDDILPFSDRYFLVMRNEKAALYDRSSGRLIVPFKYDDIQAGDDDGYFVYRNGLMGTLDNQFREEIPCLYTRFRKMGELVFTWDERYEGIYSIKTHKEIFPARYTRISQSGMRFKAYRNDLIYLVEINEQHQVVQKASIDNAIAVALVNGARQRKAVDYRLFSLGWYLDSVYVTPEEGDPFYSLKWGLAHHPDSILIKPSISNLVYLVNSPYTLQSFGQQNLKLGDKLIGAPSFKAIFHETGKMLPNYNIISYDSTDFRRRDYMRISTLREYAVLRSDGTAKSCAYLEKGSARFPRYCESKTIVPVKEKTECSTEIPSVYFYPQRNFLNQFTGDMRFSSEGLDGLTYPEGKWNYFDNGGEPLFNESFSFAHPFEGGHAIVMKGETWGVVSADTVIIDPIYSGITRKITGADTFFIAEQEQQGFRFLDPTAHVLPETFTILKQDGNHLLIDWDGVKSVLDSELHTISEGYSSYKFLGNGFILAKLKKEYVVLDPSGAIAFECKTEPELVLTEDYIVMKNKSLLDICDKAMTPVLIGCKSIERLGPFILVEKEGKRSVFDIEMTPLLSKITGTVLTDTIVPGFAVTENNSVSVYSAAGKRTAKFKGITPDAFSGGRFIVQKGDSSGVFSAYGKRTLGCSEITEVKVLANGSMLLKTKTKANFLFDRNWHRLLPEESRLTALRYHGGPFYSFRSDKGKFTVCNVETALSDTGYLQVEGMLSNGFLLVKKPAGFTYIDEAFRPLTKTLFKEALPFSGNLAPVGDKRGWTLLTETGKQISYPNFGPIAPVLPTLFKTTNTPFYGLFSSTGKQLIPVQYEELNFLPQGIIQAIRNGEVTYFRLNGTSLF